MPRQRCHFSKPQNTFEKDEKAPVKLPLSFTADIMNTGA